ncbi:uncharacterized protein LOC135848790 isoform X4 [Planococcus citri]|uniref:uncharacterized protein LOC135848790 isoform X4 n=1 Tax=Planococcus citri TaxID=170843 RepID=UPI0031F8E14C
MKKYSGSWYEFIDKGAMSQSKQQSSSFQDAEQFLSHSYSSEDEFVEKYKKFYQGNAKSKQLYLFVLITLENSVVSVISTYERSWTEESSLESIFKEADEFGEEIQQFLKFPDDKQVNILLKMYFDLKMTKLKLEMTKSAIAGMGSISKKREKIEEEIQKFRDLHDDKKVNSLLEMQSDPENIKLELEIERNKTKSAIAEMEEERNLRKTLQCLMDFAELMESFLEWCYPNWAGVRKPYTYGKDVWKHVLYNLEDPQVQLLKTELRKASISEESFIRAMDSFLKLGFQNAHFVMRPIERQDAYPVFLKSLSSAGKVVVRTILSFMFRFTDDDKLILLKYSSEMTTTTPNPEDIAAAEKMRQDTEVQRNVYRLIHIPNFKLSLRDEDYLEKDVKDFVEKLNGKGDFNIRMTCAFIAMTEEKKGAFILFDSFHSALKIFNHIKATPPEVGLHVEELDDMKLVSVEKTPIFDDVAELKITGKAVTGGLNPWNQDVAISEYQLFCSLFKVKTILKTEIGRCLKMTEGEFSVFCSYKTFESVLIAYQTVKERLRSRNIAAEVSIIKTADVHLNKLTPVDIKC